MVEELLLDRDGPLPDGVRHEVLLRDVLAHERDRLRDLELQDDRHVEDVLLELRVLRVARRRGQGDAIGDRVRDQDLPEKARLLRRVGGGPPVQAAARAQGQRKGSLRPHERRLQRELVIRVVVHAVDLHGDVRNEDVVHADADRGPAVETPEGAAARVLDRLVEAVREDGLERALCVRERGGRLREPVAHGGRDALVGATGSRRVTAETTATRTTFRIVLRMDPPRATSG